VNSNWYVSKALNPFFNQLRYKERQYRHFQQENHIADTTDMSTAAICGNIFENRIISKGLRTADTSTAVICGTAFENRIISKGLGTADTSTAAICGVAFENRIISKGLWTPGSLDISVTLLPMGKSRKNNPCAPKVLQNKITL
jgi:hypothetical protein